MGFPGWSCLPNLLEPVEGVTADKKDADAANLDFVKVNDAVCPLPRINKFQGHDLDQRLPDWPNKPNQSRQPPHPPAKHEA